MAIVNRSTAKTYFNTGDKPTESEFSDFIDSAIFQEDFSNFGKSLVSAQTATSVRNILDSGTIGDILFRDTTQVSAQNNIGGGTVGKNVFTATTTASAQQNIGGGTVGRQIFEATTTASATNIVNQTATSTAQGIAYLPLPIDPITAGNNSTTPNTDVDFFAGTMTFNDYSGQVKATAMTKRLQSTGSWSAGNNGNGLLSGARANSSTYHWFALYKASDNSVDYGCILGVAGTTPDPTSVLPSGYSKYQYIFSVLTDGSGNIRRSSYSFRLDGSYTCEYNTYIENRAYSASPLTATLLSLSVPLGLKLIAKTIVYGIYSGASTRIHLILIDPAKTTTVATSGNFNFSGYQSSSSNAHSSSIETLTDTSGRVSLMSTSGAESQVITTGFTYNPINR